MAVFLYDIGLFLYTTGIRISSLFNEKARKWILGRKGVFKGLKNATFHNPIWFHCASVGEFEQGLPLLKKLQEQFPDSSFLVTFFSPSGYEYAKKRHPELPVLYLPVDTKENARRWISIVQPKVVFFIKYEFWYHYLYELKGNQIPTFLVSGIFRKDQGFFKWYGQLQRRMLGSFTYLFLQDEASKKLLESIGIINAGVFGDTRIDRVAELSRMDFQDDTIQEFTADSKIFIAGSVWDSDKETLTMIIGMLPSDWKVILAPHEPGHYDTSWIQEDFIRYSARQERTARIMILDTLGLLSKLYRKASMVYIGGGFGKGIHNILEAAIYAVPILIGPNYHKFREAVELITEQVVFDLSENGSEKVLEQLLDDPKLYSAVCERCNRYMARQSNVSEKILVYLNDRKWLS